MVASAQREFRRRIDALDGIFQFLDEFALIAGLDDRSKSRLGLVVEELFTNMVRHSKGAGHDVGIRLERRDQRLHLELTDDDVEPFDPDTVPVPDVSAGLESRRPGGLGLHLVRAMVDELDYRYEPETRRMRVSVTSTLES